MTKKLVYDQGIAPKLKEIAEICRKHGIPMMVHLALDENSEGTERRTLVTKDGMGLVPCDIMCALLQIGRHEGIDIGETLAQLQMTMH